jgi:hypothetical protein
MDNLSCGNLSRSPPSSGNDRPAGCVQRASSEGLRHHPNIPGKPIIIPGSDRLFDRHDPGIVITITPES